MSSRVEFCNTMGKLVNCMKYLKCVANSQRNKKIIVALQIMADNRKKVQVLKVNSCHYFLTLGRYLL